MRRCPSATIILKDGPRTFSCYEHQEILSSCELTSITVNFDSFRNGGVLYRVDFTGTCTYTQSDWGSIFVRWKLYDSDGFLVESGSLFASSVEAGVKFKGSDTIGVITPGETYTLELSDYVF